MDRFFADRIEGKKASIFSKDEISHITKTLRMKIGDEVELIDGKGAAFSAIISDISKEKIILDLMEKLPNDGELSTEIVVYQGIPKSQKMDFIVQKLTEIGVQKIVPIKMDRCVKQIGEKEDKLLARWQKIALEAVKQSKRTKIPAIEHSLSLKELLEEMKQNHQTFLCYENEDGRTLKQIFRENISENFQKNNLRIGIIIGPEGGITEQEKEQLVAAGAISVSLGKSILRTETAALVGASILAYELE